MAVVITNQANTIKFALSNGDVYHIDKDNISFKKKFGFVHVYGSEGVEEKATKLRMRYSEVTSPSVASNDLLIATLLGYKVNTGITVGDVRITDGAEVVDIKENTHTSGNEMLVNLEGHICTNNSSSTPLGVDGVFPGSWEDNIDFGTIVVSIKSDQASAANGLKIQWSADGVTVHDEDHFTILADTGKTFTFQPVRRYFKVVYTNGGVEQTTFSLETSMRRYYIKPSSHRIQDSIVAEDDAELMKSVITGQRDDGVFDNVNIDNSNHLRVNSFPYTYSIAEGDVDGHDSLLKFGTRSTLAAGTESVVWEGTNALYTYLTSAEQLKVTSTSSEDGVAGTGILTLTIHGLDGNFDEVSETVTMNGSTAVTTSNSYIRIFRAYGATCGTSGTNVGNIVIENNAETVELLKINAGDGQTLMAMWTVPDGKVAYMISGTVSTNSNKGAVVSLFTRINDGGITYPWLIKYRAYIFSGNENFDFKIPFAIEARTDIEVRMETPVAAGATSVGATFELWYEDA